MALILLSANVNLKNEMFDKGDFETMLSRRSVFPFAKNFYFYAFSKSGFSDWVCANAANNDVTLLLSDDLFGFK